MITTTALLIALASQGGGQQSDEAGKLITKMMEKYSKASTLTGAVRLTQSAGNQGGTLDTAIQYERPSKLYIRQTLNTKSSKTWIVSSDGTHYSYPNPPNLMGDDKLRVMEPVKQRNGENYDIRQIHAVAAHTLGDRNMPVDVAIGRREDLVVFTVQLATYEIEEKVKIGDVEVNVIRGKWRENAALRPKGTFELYITDDGDLKRYVIYQTVAPQPNQAPLNITSTWDVNFVVNGKPDPALFKVVK